MRYMLAKMNSLKALGKFVDWRDKVRELDEASLCTILALACTLDIAAGALADQLALPTPSHHGSLHNILLDILRSRP